MFFLNPGHSFPRPFVPTRFLRRPDIRAHIKWPPRSFVRQSLFITFWCALVPRRSYIVMWTNVRGGNLIWARMSGVVIWCEHECPGGHLMWARMSGVVIGCEHECPGWSFDVSTNVRPCQKSRGNECPWEQMYVHRFSSRRFKLVILSKLLQVHASDRFFRNKH